MPFQISFERRILSGAEFRAVEPSHHPTLKTLTREQLGTVAKAIRAYHDKARDLLHQHKRQARGKPGPVAARSADGRQRAATKHQILADALKRVSARIAVLDAEAKRKRTTALLKDALARKRAAAATRPAAGRTAAKGMRATPNAKRRTRVNPGKVGSVSKQVRRAQARRDAR